MMVAIKVPAQVVLSGSSSLNGSVKISSVALCGAIGNTCIDSFTGTVNASLTNPPWTMLSGTGFSPILYIGSGEVQAGPNLGWAVYTSGSFGSNQFSQYVYEGDTSGTGLAVRMTVGGNGYVWEIIYNKIAIYNAGSFVADYAASCPTPSNGDTIKLSISSNVITCADITSSTSSTWTDTANTYTTGIPGFAGAGNKLIGGPFQGGSQ